MHIFKSFYTRTLLTKVTKYLEQLLVQLQTHTHTQSIPNVLARNIFCTHASTTPSPIYQSSHLFICTHDMRGRGKRLIMDYFLDSVTLKLSPKIVMNNKLGWADSAAFVQVSLTCLFARRFSDIIFKLVKLPQNDRKHSGENKKNNNTDAAAGNDKNSGGSSAK